MKKSSYHLRFTLNGEEKSLDIAIADMAGVLRPHLAIVDGTTGQEGLGPSAGDPKPLDVVVVSADAFAADAGQPFMLAPIFNQANAARFQLELLLLGHVGALAVTAPGGQHVDEGAARGAREAPRQVVELLGIQHRGNSRVRLGKG